MGQIILNIALLLILPFLFSGVILRIKSFWAGRKGPSVFQPLWDFLKLLGKTEVISTTATPLFQAAPAILFAATVSSGLVTPMVQHTSVFSFEGDFIFFAYALALGKFVSILSAMETGSSFEGMGASREAFYSVLTEPAFFLLMGSLALSGHIASFRSLFTLENMNHPVMVIVTVLSAISLFMLLLTEGSRVPVDDPNTHLELTMVHEVMVLDNSGPDLALISHSTAMKMFLYASLIANFFIPAGIGFSLGLLFYLLIILGIAVLVGLVESLLPRLKMTHVPQFIFILSSFSLIILSVVSLLIFGGVE